MGFTVKKGSEKGFTVKKGSEKGFAVKGVLRRVLRGSSEKEVSRRCPKRPLGEHDPFGRAPYDCTSDFTGIFLPIHFLAVLVLVGSLVLLNLLIRVRELIR